MSQGQYVFTQLCSFLPKRVFDCLVDKYEGNKWLKSFTCWHHLLVMVFGQLSNRKSMRDLIVTLNAHRCKFYRLGFGKSVTRSNLSKANEVREASILKVQELHQSCVAAHYFGIAIKILFVVSAGKTS